MRVSLGLAALAVACGPSLETRQVVTVHAVAPTQTVAVEPFAQPPPVVAVDTTSPIPPPRVFQPGAVIEGPVAPPTPRAPLVVAEGGPLAVRCPPPQRALAGSPVHLAADVTGASGRIRWSVTQSPQARYYRFAERFDENDSDGIVAVGQVVPFTSVIVGDYTVRADVRDAEGHTASCETQVTMAGHGLRVELSWNTSNTDVDLHMLADGDGRWASPSDCYFGNRTPDTALPEEGRRRWLDTDDVDGEGPENIRVDTPRTDTDYQVGVHYYSSHGQSGPTTAIVMLYCGDQRVARFEHALTGTQDPGNNPFWRVASVRVRPDGTCAVSRPRGPEVVPHNQATAMGGGAVVAVDE